MNNAIRVINDNILSYNNIKIISLDYFYELEYMYIESAGLFPFDKMNLVIGIRIGENPDNNNEDYCILGCY
jgi:hypothetical protein